MSNVLTKSRRLTLRLALLHLLFCGGAALPALADQLNQTGDGSGSNNPDLMSSTSSCASACGVAASSQPIDLYGPPPVIDQGDRLVPGADNHSALLDASVPGINGMPYESDAPWFETDWSIRLRGSYIESTRGTQALVSVEPNFSLLHASRRGQFTLDTSAELIMDRNDTPRIGAVDLSLEQTLAIDPVSNLTATGDVSLSQESANDPGVSANVLTMPLEFDGAASLGVDRQFGQLGLDASVDGSRYLATDTQLVSGPQSNLDQQYWNFGGTLRAGYAITPILTPFVEAGAHYTIFDAAPASTGIALDGWDYAISGGLAANWQDVFTAEASVGLGVRRFDDASLSAMRSAIYALDLTYAPDETVAFGVTLSTELDPGDPDNALQRSVIYAASADVSYLMNSWLTLRGSIDGELTEPETGSLRTVNVGGGVGADVMLTDNTSLTFDYAYDESRTVSQPVERAHAFALGVMFSR